MLRKFISVSIAFAVIFCCIVPTAFSAAAENVLYVSPDGSDTADGSFLSPLCSLEGAKNAAKSMTGHVTVYFRAGTYLFDNTVNFDENDKSDVTYKAYDGEKVVFTSGAAYSGFEKCTVNGHEAFKKYVGTDADFSILFDENKMLEQGRFPSSGYLKVKSVSDDDMLIKPENESEYYTAYSGMYADSSELSELDNIESATVKILHWWKDETLQISDYDGKTGHITFDKAPSMTVNAGDRFFLLNVYEAVDELGEWYLDKSDGVLYVIPEEGSSPDDYTVFGATLETLINVDGVDSISFENIIFRGNGRSYYAEREHSQAAYNADSCVKYKNASDFHIKNCEFRDIGASVVFVGENVENADVDSCVFNNIGAQAVFVKGENIDVTDERVTKNIRIINNSISEYGRYYYNAVGVLVIHANSVEISHNEIHDGYYTAVSVGWVWGYSYSVTYNNKICDNLIYSIGQGWLSDMGGIYTLGNQPGTVISGNVIHNVSADSGEGGYGGWGIYLDEGSSYITVEKNLVYACGSDAYHLHYGSYNTVRNNIFALSGESQVRIVSAPDRCTPNDGGKKTVDIYNNIILTDKKTRALSYIRNENTMEEYNNLYWDVSNGNDVYFDMNNNPKRSTGIRTAVRKGIINNPIVKDPMFRDVANFNFELSSNSPAIKAGFEKWDYSEAGTLSGTTIGISAEGGQTPYNANSSSVPMTPSKELFHCVLNAFCIVVDFFKNLFGELKK
jgi:hypothetical protein